MANANINIQLSNGKQAGQTINELRQQANRLTREVNNLKPGTEEFVKKSADLNKVTGRLGEVRKEAKGVSVASQGMVQEMMQFVPFSGQLNTLAGGFKSLRVAMMAIPILAIVGAFAALFQWFRRTEEGAQKLRVITAAVSQVFDSLMDVASAAGKELFEMFSNPKEAVKDLWEAIKTNILNRFTGLIDSFKFAGKAIKAALNLDWDAMKENAAAAGESILQATTGIDDLPGKVKKGVDSAKESIKDLYDEVKEDVEGAVALQERENRLMEQKREFKVREAQLENEISEARLIGNNQELTTAERAAAMTEALEKQQQLSNERVKLAEEELRIQQERNALSDSTEADLEKEAELEAQIIRIRKQSTDQSREIFSMLTGLRKQEHDKQVRDAEAAAKAEMEAAKELEDLRIEVMEDGVEKQIAKIELDTDRKIVALTGSAEQIAEQEKLLEEQKQQEIQAIKDKYAAEEADKAKSQAAKLQKIEEEKHQALMGSLNVMGQLFGGLASFYEEGTEQYKQFAIAQAVMSTFQAAIEAYKSTSAIPIVGPALAPIAAATALAFGFKQVQAIRETKPSEQKFEQGGILRGNRHSNGGIAGVVRSTGQPIEMEDGEIILNRRVGMSAFGRAAASNLNAMFGGTKFEAGGPVNPLAGTAPVQQAVGAGSGGNRELLVLVSEFRAMKAEVLRWPKVLKVHNNVQETREGLKTLNSLERDVDV
jgi:hypothetical protein